MKRTVLFALYTATAIVPLGLLAVHAHPAPPAAAPTKTAATGDAVVDAANAFLGTLSPEQRAAVQITGSARAAAKWTNLPVGSSGRNGVRLSTLNETQRTAALKVARLALGESGYVRLQEIRAADDVLGKAEKEGGRGPGGGFGGPPPGGFGGPPDGGGPDGPPPGFGGPGGPGGGGPGDGFGAYGANNYNIAFLGKPSPTTPWMIQIGGHHLAFNLSYKGQMHSTTPYFIGVEPTSWKDSSGKTHAPLAPMRDAMVNMLASLAPAQQAQAKLSSRFSDVLVGPNHDGRFPTSEGVKVSELSPASRALVKKAIAAWVQDSAMASTYQALYDSELDKTYIAYSGSPTLNNHADYVRIDGPHVWIEFVCQDGIVFRNIHYHTIWRDRVTDYNAEYKF